MTTAGEGQAADVWSCATWKRATACGEASCVEVAMIGDEVAVRDSKVRRSPVLVFAASEWQSFLGAVRRGEFDLPSPHA